MEKQLDIQQLFNSHKEQQFKTLTEEFSSFKKVVIQAIEQSNREVLMAALGNYSEPFILFGDHYEVLQFFYDIEEPISVQCPEMLAVLYLIIGHCYYIQLNQKLAKNYYKKATSIAFEYQIYEVISITGNNISNINIDHVPDETLFEISKMSAIFYLLKKTQHEPNFIYRIITHAEMAIRTKRFDYANQVLARFADSPNIKEKSRMWYQIKALKGEILFGKGQCKAALITFQEVLMACVVDNHYKDIIIYCSEKLRECFTFLNNQKRAHDFEQSSNRYLSEVESINQKLENYFKQKVSHLLEDRYSESRETFEQEAQILFSDLTEPGYTLAVVEFKTLSQDSRIVEHVIDMLNDEMLTTFSANVVLSARMNKTTVSFVITLPEQQFDEEVKAVFATIRQRYPRGASDLEAMYFASVNNKDNGLASYEKCLELANAYIYYELYK